MIERAGEWMQTFSGVAFYVTDPHPADVRLVDIAHHLAIENRYCGASPFPWSVAQHSILVARRAVWRVSGMRGWTPETLNAVLPVVAAAGYLHDSAEAYVKDIHRPLKRSLREYKPIEKRVMACILERFFGPKMIIPSWIWSRVEEADVDVLAMEQRVLMPNTPQKWDERVTSRPLDEETRVRIYEQSWRNVECDFLDRLARSIADAHAWWVR